MPVGTPPETSAAAPGTHLPVSEPDLTDRAAKGALAASGVLIISTLMPWVSVTFFNASTLDGIRVAEGRTTFILAILAVLVTITALVMDEQRRNMLLGSAILGLICLIVTIVFAFRYDDIFDIPASLGGQRASAALADAGIGLEAGWFLAIASSLALIALGVFGYLKGRPKTAVPNMTWVNPQA
jgi:hypothetical protein